MTLVFLTHSVLSVLSEWLLFGVFNCALSLTLGAWQAIFSPTLLCAGLLPAVTIISASHSSRFYHVVQFHSLVVNIRYCAIFVPSVQIVWSQFKLCTTR